MFHILFQNILSKESTILIEKKIYSQLKILLPRGKGTVWVIYKYILKLELLKFFLIQTYTNQMWRLITRLMDLDFFSHTSNYDKDIKILMYGVT